MVTCAEEELNKLPLYSSFLFFNHSKRFTIHIIIHTLIRGPSRNTLNDVLDAAVRSNFGFSTLLKGTSTCQIEEPGIEPFT